MRLNETRKGCQPYKKPTGFGEVFLNPKKTSFELFFGRNLPLLTCFLGEVIPEFRDDEAWSCPRTSLGIVLNVRFSKRVPNPSGFYDAIIRTFY